MRAPGSDHALATAAPLAISVDGGAPVVVRVPTVARALYAEVSGWKEIGSPDSTKHLVDAAQLLAAATIADLDTTSNGIPPKALQKRLRWLEEALKMNDRRDGGHWRQTIAVTRWHDSGSLSAEPSDTRHHRSARRRRKRREPASRS